MICPMCSLEVSSFHKRSHVLPDWMFKESYSENHKIIHVDLNEVKAEKKQSAIHGSYWCEACENRSNVDDTYGSLILTDRAPTSPEYKRIGKRELSAADEIKAGVELWTGIEFKRFQNFVFSILIRGELFARSNGKSIMAEKHFEKIKEFYNSPNLLDDTSYPIIVIRSPELDTFKNYSFLPYHSRLNGHHGVLFRGGGFQFNVYASSHTKPHGVLLGRANTAGEIPVIVDYYKNSGPYKSSQEQLAKIANKFPMQRFSRGRKHI